MGFFDNVSIFGYTFSKAKKEEPKDKSLISFDYDQDSSNTIEVGGEGGAYGYSLETISTPANEIESIRTYRTMATSAKIDLVLNEIFNEVFIFDIPGKKAIDISFDNNTSKISKAIKNKIHDAFDEVYKVTKFRELGLTYFKSWYVDSRIYLHMVIDTNDKKAGIKRVIMIDPIKMKKIREVPPRDANGLIDYSKIKEYYVYSESYESIGNKKGVSSFKSPVGLKITKESIAYSDSGILLDGVVLGYLDKAIIPYNNLKMMEVSLLIYRVSRAPERRIIYVDVGNLPKNKAEQHIRELMNKFKNKLVYDSKTGALADKKNVLSMMEDYWLPRRDGKSTEISTLPGGENLGITSDVEYFSNELNNALNVPHSRFSDQAPTFMFGKGQEVNRDEYRFKKFIDKIRNKFITVLADLLRTQLLLKGVIVESDWDTIQDEISWIYAEDNNFVEFKESESLNNKLASLQMVDPFVGKYFSIAWVNKNILKLTDEEIVTNDKEIEEEKTKMQAFSDAGNSDNPGVDAGNDEPVDQTNNTEAQPEDNYGGAPYTG